MGLYSESEDTSRAGAAIVPAISPAQVPRPSSIDGRRPRTVALSSSVLDEECYGTVETDTIGDHAVPIVTEAGICHLPPLTIRETAILALQFTLVWFAANWSLNAGLGLTNVTSGTTLSSASGFFTLALGSFFGVEMFSWSKLAAVTMSFIGVVLVTNADSRTSSTSVLSSFPPTNDNDNSVTINLHQASFGDALALLSAFFYAVYVTLLKVRIGAEERVSMPLFFGFVGLINIVGLWPLGIFLHVTGIEPLQLPTDALTWMGVVANMGITFVSDFAYLLAMLKSSPLLATVGLSLTIPLAVLGDFLRNAVKGDTSTTGSMDLQRDAGSLLVLVSLMNKCAQVRYKAAALAYIHLSFSASHLI